MLAKLTVIIIDGDGGRVRDQLYISSGSRTEDLQIGRERLLWLIHTVFSHSHHHLLTPAPSIECQELASGREVTGDCSERNKGGSNGTEAELQL